MTEMHEDQILARIDSALVRVEAALHPPSNSARPSYAELAARHDTLRAAVRGALSHIDDLIAELSAAHCAGAAQAAPGESATRE